jgi:hypothetical protein
MARRLLVLNGLAAFAVVLHHAAAYGLQAMFEWTDRYRLVDVPNYDQIGTLSYYALLSIRHLGAYALPAFLFVSGFFIAFMARGNASTLERAAIFARIQQLLIPFVLWTIFRFVLIRRVPSSLDEVLWPYHFIPVLCQFYLLSPFIVRMARSHWKLLLVGSALLQLTLITARFLSVLDVEIPFHAQIMGLPRWLFTQYIFWFPFGVVVSLHIREFKLRLEKVKWFLLGALIFLAIFGRMEYELVAYHSGAEWLGPTYRGYSGNFYPLAFILCFLAFDKVSLPFAKEFSYIGTMSLGIYMANIPAIYIVAVLMYFVTPWALGQQLVYQIVLITAGLGGPLLLMAFTRRSPARVAYRYVFG